MSSAPQGRPAEPSLGASLLRQVGGAVVLVALVSGVFWAIGTLERDDDGELAADTTEDSVESPDDATDDGDAQELRPDPPEDTPPTDDGTDAGTDDGTDAGTDDGTSDEQEPDADDGSDNGDDGDDGSDNGDAATEEPPAEPAIEPSTISVQVLDGYQADGGAAANAVAAQLRDAGYNLIAQNPALRYDVTTVLWTAGHEAEARQVAAEIGAPEARQQSGNLSTQVAVHVVVGSDRG